MLPSSSCKPNTHEDEEGQESEAEDGADDNTSNSTTTKAFLIFTLAVGHARGSGDGGAKGHAGGDSGQLDTLAAVRDVRVVAARVGGVDATGRAVRTNADGAVGIAAVGRLVANGWDAVGARQGIGRQCAVGEVGTDLVLSVTIRVPAEALIGRDIGLAFGVLCLLAVSRHVGASDAASARTYAIIGTEWPGCIACQTTGLDRVLDDRVADN